MKFIKYIAFAISMFAYCSNSQVINIRLRTTPIIMPGEVTEETKRKFLNYIPDKLTTSTYRMNYVGPPISLYAALKEEIKGVRVYCTSFSTYDLANPNAIYKTNVPLSTSPSVIIEKLYNINSGIKIQYTIKTPKSSAASAKKIEVSITTVLD